MSTITNSTLASGWTQSTLASAIITAFSNAGVSTVYDNYTASGTQNLVFEAVFNAAKTFGKVYIRITISSTFSVQQTLYTAWNTTTRVGTNASSANTAITFVNTIAVSFKAINSSADGSLIYMYQVGTSLYQINGYIRPSTLNNVDEGSYCTALQFNSYTSKALLGTAANPHANSSYAIQDNSYLQGSNHFSQRDTYPRLQIFSGTGKGLLGETSDNYCLAAYNGLAVFEASTSYIVLIAGNAGIGVK